MLKRFLPLLIFLLIGLTAYEGSAIIGNVTFDFRVLDSDSATPIRGIKPIGLYAYTGGGYGNPWSLVGVYGHSDRYEGPSLKFKISPELSEYGGMYEFVGWDVSSPPCATVSSAGQSLIVESGCESATIQVTLYLSVKARTLKVSVYPPGSGRVKPYDEGTHMIKIGTKIRLSPVPNSRWEFSYWLVDGQKVVKKNLQLIMDSDHDVEAHFKKRGGNDIEDIGSGPSEGEKGSEAVRCIKPDGYPYSLKYRGYYRDVMAIRDLLKELGGKADPFEFEDVITLGRMDVTPQPWEKYGVRLEGDHLEVNGLVYKANRWKDYGVLFESCGSDGRSQYRAWAAGITEYGTRAALMWLLNHPEKASGKLLIVVEWVDANYDHLVQDEEIMVVYEIP